MSVELVRTGIWWDPATFAQARAAYVFDLDHHREAPAGFIHWLHWVLEAHVARGVRGRAALEVPARGPLGTDGLNRMHPLRVELLEAMDEAIAQDRIDGRVLSRSAWVHEAVTVAVDDARRRAGGQLRELHPAVRLPNRPRKADRT